MKETEAISVCKDCSKLKDGICFYPYGNGLDIIYVCVYNLH
jgi:hypothetical protein